MTRFAVLSSITACFSVLTFSLAVSGFTRPAIGVALSGAAWLILFLRRINRFTGLAFFLFGLISVGALWAGIALPFALAGMIFALLAWDLTAFEERLKQTSERSDIRRMEFAHFGRLALVIGLGLAGVAASNWIQIKLTLGSALVLVLLGIWGISTLVYRLRRGA